MKNETETLSEGVVNQNSELKNIQIEIYKSREIIKQEWIDFSKSLKDEYPDVNVTESQYEWFGNTMSLIKRNSEYKFPSGSECRNYPRGFFRLVSGGKDWVKKVFDMWIEDTYSEWIWNNLKGYSCDYDLIGYGIHELFQTDSWKICNESNR